MVFLILNFYFYAGQIFLQHFYFDNVEIYLCSDMAFNLSNINVNTKPIFKELILKRTDQETEYKIEDIIKNLLGTNIITISYIYKYQNNDLCKLFPKHSLHHQIHLN